MATFRLNSKAAEGQNQVSIGNDEYKWASKKSVVEVNDPMQAADLRRLEWLTEVDSTTTDPAVAGAPSGEGE